MENLLDTEESLRFGANMMIANGNDELEDGTKLTIALFDSWEPERKRSFFIDFLSDRWNSMEPEAQHLEIKNMTQVCHECGTPGDTKDGTPVTLLPDPSLGYIKLQCSSCAEKHLLDGSAKAERESKMMILRVQPHPDFMENVLNVQSYVDGVLQDPYVTQKLKVDPPGDHFSKVMLQGLSSRPELNGRTGKLRFYDTKAKRWAVRLEDPKETVSIRPANVRFTGEMGFRVRADGSTTLRKVRDEMHLRMGARYNLAQLTLWVAYPKPRPMALDTPDERGILRNRRLRDYGVRAEGGSQRRLLYVSIGGTRRGPNGLPEELDPDSKLRKQRAWPDWMSYDERAAAHLELYGEENYHHGPPYHPDVEQMLADSGYPHTWLGEVEPPDSDEDEEPE